LFLTHVPSMAQWYGFIIDPDWVIVLLKEKSCILYRESIPYQSCWLMIA
jgi:hypothetical protein